MILEIVQGVSTIVVGACVAHIYNRRAKKPVPKLRPIVDAVVTSIVTEPKRWVFLHEVQIGTVMYWPALARGVVRGDAVKRMENGNIINADIIASVHHDGTPAHMNKPVRLDFTDREAEAIKEVFENSRALMLLGDQ